MGADRSRNIDQFETAIREHRLGVGIDPVDAEFRSPHLGLFPIKVADGNHGHANRGPRAQVIEADHAAADKGRAVTLSHRRFPIGHSHKSRPNRPP